MSFDCRYLVKQKTGMVIRGPAANRPFASIQYRLQRCTTNVLRRSQTPFVNVLAIARALTDTMLMALLRGAARGFLDRGRHAVQVRRQAAARLAWDRRMRGARGGRAIRAPLLVGRQRKGRRDAGHPTGSSRTGEARASLSSTRASLASVGSWSPSRRRRQASPRKHPQAEILAGDHGDEALDARDGHR
jgi:hypothetical protein